MIFSRPLYGISVLPITCATGPGPRGGPDARNKSAPTREGRHRRVRFCARLRVARVCSDTRTATLPFPRPFMRAASGSARLSGRETAESGARVSASARGAMRRAFVRTRERRHRSPRVRFCARLRVARAFPDARWPNPTHECPFMRAGLPCAGAHRASCAGMAARRGTARDPRGVQLFLR